MSGFLDELVKKCNAVGDGWRGWVYMLRGFHVSYSSFKDVEAVFLETQIEITDRLVVFIMWLQCVWGIWSVLKVGFEVSR